MEPFYFPLLLSALHYCTRSRPRPHPRSPPPSSRLVAYFRSRVMKLFFPRICPAATIICVHALSCLSVCLSRAHPVDGYVCLYHCTHVYPHPSPPSVLSSTLVFVQVHYYLFLYQRAVLNRECMEEEKRASMGAPPEEGTEKKEKGRRPV